MAGQIEIINVALSRIGANAITSLEEGTAEQKHAVNLWDIARRACLRDHPWNFATKDVELNQISGYVSFGFAYAYQLPSDNVRLLQVYGNPTYKVQGRRILSDEPICKIKYVYDVTDPSEWDASFDDLMAQRLAADMAYALTKSQSTADSMFAIYDRKLKTARHIDSTEDVHDMLGGNASQYIGVRG
ncbi:MAG: hypothetical protein Q7T13_01645 [Polaromonas sp.]|nr:hypothetical protein [Polaromonas sp.]